MTMLATMRTRVVLVIATMAVIGGCATVDPWTDTRIESEVKARLVAEHDANLTRLGVVSREATVYLSGAVESEDPERARVQPVSGAADKAKQNVAPRSALLVTHRRPPCAATIERQIASPSPSPSSLVVKKGSNTRSILSAGIPPPRSAIATCTPP